ncbi:hypothetical protein F4811DRAFT_538239 [Daldinia bambusicola]|nr:hypothetical protein F4811DRAFT_538239 [Daldinia bambusicola]
MDHYVLPAAFVTILAGFAALGAGWWLERPAVRELGEYFLNAALGGLVGYIARRFGRVYAGTVRLRPREHRRPVQLHRRRLDEARRGRAGTQGREVWQA